MAISLPYAPKTEAPEEPGLIDFNSGIPQSSEPPSMTEAFGENPWDVDERERKAADIEWFTKSQGKHDLMLDDPDKAFDGFDMGIARTRNEAVMLYQNDAFVQLHTRGETPPDPNGLGRKLLRVQLAEQLFEGRGSESEEAFNVEIKKSRQSRKDVGELRQSLAETASVSAIIGAAGEKAQTFAEWRKEAINHPGYKPEMDGDLYEAFYQIHKAEKEVVEPFKDELAAVWDGFKNGKSNFYLIFDKLEEGEREGFKKALGTTLRAHPEEDRRGFFASAMKQTGRTFNSLAPTMLEEIVNFPETVMSNSFGGDHSEEALASKEAEAEQDRIRKDFINEVRKMAEGEYDPITASVPWLNDSIERGLHQVPGLGLTTLAAFVPYAGQVAFYGMAKEESYGIIRAQVLASTGDEAKARQVGRELSGIAAVPYALLDRFSAKGLVGKVPLIEKGLTRVADVFGKNLVARGSARAIGGATFETGTEALQAMMPVIAMEMDKAFGVDAGQTNWTGEGGVLDGFWAQNLETFVASFPLALLRIPGGLKADQKAQILATATHSELVANGYTPDDATAIIEARVKGHASVNIALENAQERHDAKSETAKDATQELAEEIQRQRETAEDMQRLGLFPTFRTGKHIEGVEVYDPQTGELIASVPTTAKAMDVAYRHIEIEEQNRNVHLDAEISSMLDLLQLRSEKAQDENAKYDLEMSNRMDTTIKRSQLLQDISRLAEQNTPEALAEIARKTATFERIDQQIQRLSAIERMNGGTGEVTKTIFGEMETEVRGKERAMIRRIYEEGTALTVVHEDSHAIRRTLLSKGILNDQELFETLSSIDAEGAKAKRANYVPFFPEGTTKPTQLQLDEAFSEFAEVLILGTRKGGKSSERYLVNKNLSAIAKGQSRGGKVLSAFIAAYKKLLGMSLGRVTVMNKAVRDGVIDASKIEEFRAMLQGTSAQEEFDADVKAEWQQYQDSLAEVDEDTPFSIGDRRSLPGGFEGGLADVVKSTSVSGLTRANRRKDEELVPLDDSTKPMMVSREYREAKKNGDGAAALRIVKARLKAKKAIEDLKSRIDTDKPVILVPVMHRDLGKRANAIPMAYALEIEYLTGWKVSEDIVKVGGDANTGATGYARATNDQSFDGLVDPDAQYILVDDTFTGGDTLVSLYEYITANGGKVSAMTTLAASSSQNYLAARPQDTQKLLDKMELDHEGFLREFGFPIERLTGSEIYRYANRTKGINSPASFRSLISKSGGEANPLGSIGGKGASGEGDLGTSFSLGRATVTPTASTRTFQGQDGETVIGPASFSIGAFHGTPHKVDKFTTEKIGTGEGAQAYGWGLYFADSEAVAADYRDALSNLDGTHRDTLKVGKKAIAEVMAEGYTGRQIVDIAAERLMAKANGLDAYPAQASPYKDAAKNIRAIYKSKGGNLYRVTLKVEEEDLLDYDGEMTDEQAAKVAPLFKGNGTSRKVSFLYKELSGGAGESYGGGSPELASSLLASVGIRGIRFLDGNSRADGQGSYNYVIFDEADIDILEENGQPVNTNSQGIVDSSFSIGHSRATDTLIESALKRVKRPETRIKIMGDIARRLEAGRRDVARTVRAFGRDVTQREIVDPRQMKSLRKESAVREAVRRQQLEDDAHAKHGSILEDDTLTKLKEQAVHAYLADPDSPLKGRLMSRGSAISKGENFFNPNKQGDYDGAEGVSRSVFGGNMAPDVAAQELFEAGLLKSPTPDALWDALKKEAESVGKMKDYLAAAKADMKGAKETAKADAKAWLDQSVKDQARDHSPQARIRRALVTLDAILMALPAELRGKVGGYTTLANLNSDEARLEYLLKKLDKADEVVEEFLKKGFIDQIDKVLAKASPKRGGGKKPKGKLGASAHRYFEQVEAAIALSQMEVETRLAAIEKEISEIEEDSYDAKTYGGMIADLAEQRQILIGYGNLADKGAAELETAALSAIRTYETGRNLWKTIEENRLEEVAVLATEILDDLGNPDTADVQLTKDEDAKFGSMLKNGRWGIYSFSQLLTELLGKDSKIAERWGGEVRRAFAARTSAITKAHKRWKKVTEAATGLKGLKARQRLHAMNTERTVKLTPVKTIEKKIRVPIDTFFDAASRKSLGLSKNEIAELEAQFEALPPESRKQYLTITRTTQKAGKEAKFTESEAIFLTMAWGQEAYREGLGKHGFGEGAQEALEDQISEAGKQIRDFMATEYADNYEPLRQVFARMFGVDLPQTKNYAPGKFYSQGQEQVTDPTGAGGFVEGGIMQGFLKERKKHTAEVRTESSFEVFFSHLNQTEHWKAVAEISREINGVLSKPEVKKALQAKNPRAAAVLTMWMKAIEGNGLNNPNSKLVDWLLQQQAYAALAWKPVTILKNFVGASLNAAYKMPLKDFVRGYGRLMSGKLDLRGMFETEIIQNRLAGGSSPEVRAAIGRAMMEKPTRRGDFLLSGMEVHGYADGFATAMGAAITYDYHRTKAIADGIPEAQAEAFALDMAAKTISETAQPVEITDRSIMELNAGSFAKISFVFASEVRQKSAMWLNAWMHTLTGKPTKEDIRTLFISHLIIAPAMHALGAMLLDARNDDDDEMFDDEHWGLGGFALAALTGPLGGLPLIRDVVDGYNRESGPLSRFKFAFESGGDIIDAMTDGKDQDFEFWERKITDIMKGLDATTSVAGGLLDQSYDYGKGLFGD